MIQWKKVILVDYILDKICLCNCVSSKNKNQLLIKHRNFKLQIGNKEDSVIIIK